MAAKAERRRMDELGRARRKSQLQMQLYQSVKLSREELARNPLDDQ